MFYLGKKLELILGSGFLGSSAGMMLTNFSENSLVIFQTSRDVFSSREIQLYPRQTDKSKFSFSKTLDKNPPCRATFLPSNLTFSSANLSRKPLNFHPFPAIQLSIKFSPQFFGNLKKKGTKKPEKHLEFTSQP
jgi:hypothetical protein